MADTGKSSKWTDKADKDLLIAMLQSNSPSGSLVVSANWDRVVEIMTRNGYSFTKGAMSQRWSKKIAKSASYTPGNGAADAADDEDPSATFNRGSFTPINGTPNKTSRKQGPNKSRGEGTPSKNSKAKGEKGGVKAADDDQGLQPVLDEQNEIDEQIKSESDASQEAEDPVAA